MRINSRVLIVSKTRMYDNRVCVGGIDVDNHSSVRLHNEKGYHETQDVCPYNILDLWMVCYEYKSNRPLPHSNEDVRVYSRRLLGHVNIKTNDLIQILLNNKIPFYKGNLRKVFNGCLTSSQDGGGSLFIVKGNIPNHSTCFWVCDKDIIRKDFNMKIRYNYPDTFTKWGLSIPYVGVDNDILDTIPSKTLVRLSLAHWWKKDDDDDEKCYLQISGYFGDL